MSGYTAEEISAAIEDGEVGAWDDLVDCPDPGFVTTITLRGEETEVEYVGGKQSREGGGDDIDAVIRVGDQYFKKTGWYASHDGAYWDGPLTEVRRVERMTVFYE